jgi:hypothetical protein
VQRLGAAEHGGQRLDPRPHQVQERLLGGQGHAGRLGVEPQAERALVAGTELIVQGPGPDPPGGAVLGDLLEQIEVGVEEERQARREGGRRRDTRATAPST